MVIDDLIAYAKANDLGSERYQFTYEKIGILEELGRYEESNVIADYILDHDRIHRPYRICDIGNR